MLFAYTNFIGGTAIEVFSIFIFAVFGLYAFVGFMEGYLEGRLNLVLRILCGVLAVALLWPHGLLLLNLLASAAFVGIFIYSRKFFVEQAEPAE